MTRVHRPETPILRGPLTRLAGAPALDRELSIPGAQSRCADELPRPGLERDSDSACILANEAEA
jgi:hypothetical protein